MKLGCCISSFSREGDPFGLWTLPLLAEAGYDYAELHIAAFTQLSEADFDGLLARVRSSSVPTETGCCLFTGDVSLYGEEAPILAYLEKAAYRAGKLGLEVLVFGGGKARSVPPELTEAAAFGRLAGLLKKAGEIVSAYGLTLAVEPLNRLETNMIWTMEQGRRLVEAADHPAVRLLVDYYHFCKEEDRLDEAGLPLLVHAHYAEPTKRVFPHEADARAVAFLQALAKGGYDRRISIEASAPEGEADLFRAAEVLRPCLGNESA